MQQMLAVRKAWPASECSIRSSTLLWRGQMCPSELSPTYTVTLSYQLRGHPKVYVVDSVLDPGPGRKLPHVYAGDRLCLYSTGEWNGSMHIADTVLPWAAEWLFHYELWLVTDRWAGGGHLYTSGPGP